MFPQRAHMPPSYSHPVDPFHSSADSWSASPSLPNLPSSSRFFPSAGASVDDCVDFTDDPSVDTQVEGIANYDNRQGNEFYGSPYAAHISGSYLLARTPSPPLDEIVVPQTVYRPGSKGWVTRYSPIHFIRKDKKGMPLRDALDLNYHGLVGRDDFILVDFPSSSVSLRIEFPGYKSWRRQIRAKDWRSPPCPVTLAKMSTEIARSMEKYIQDNQGAQISLEHSRWRVGLEALTLDCFILKSLVQVSKSSFQPTLILDTKHPYVHKLSIHNSKETGEDGHLSLKRRLPIPVVTTGNIPSSSDGEGVQEEAWNLTSHASLNSVASMEIEENAHVDKLPRAINAGYKSSSYTPCLPGTRVKVLQEIETWEADDANSPVYWLKGILGCGKSTIARTFAERSDVRGRLGASFFCSRDFPERRNPRLILPTLAHHLAYQHPDFMIALVPVLCSILDVEQASLDVQFQKLLVQPLKSTGLSTTIVVDAIDECEDKDLVLELLSILARYVDGIPNVKFFFTGRPEIHIRSGFAIPALRTKELSLHDVESTLVDFDLELYVRAQLEDVAIRRRYISLDSWPLEKDITAIRRKASGLFIAASAMIGFIDDPFSSPPDRLDLILSMPNSTMYASNSILDVRYSQILAARFQDIDSDRSRFVHQFCVVLGAIVLAFKPISLETLAKILETTPELISTIISGLHSVLIIPDSYIQPIRICHDTFTDFLIDSQRCRDTKLCINAPLHHLEFGFRCFNLMKTKLTKNICRLPHYAMNKDIEDLDARREAYIGSSLAYACEYWAKHLQMSIGACDDSATVVDLVGQFLRNHFLSWLEVLSIEANLRTAIPSLHDLRSWLEHSFSRSQSIPSPTSNVLDLLEDCERFILRFFDPIEASALHIYHSALQWSPTSSRTRGIYQSELSVEAKLVNAVDAAWDACIRTISVHGHVHMVAVSHRGKLIVVLEANHIHIFDAVTGASLVTYDEQQFVETVAFSPDDSILVFGLSDGTICVSSVQTGNLQTFHGHKGKVRSVSFSPCGTKVASGADDKAIRIWDMLSDCCECVLEGHSGLVLTVCWLADGSQVISGSSDHTVRIWDVSKRKCSGIIRGHTGMVISVASFQDLVASGSEDGIINIYDLRSSDVLQTISTDRPALSLQFSTQDDKIMIMYTSWNSATIWDISEGTQVSTTVLDGYHIKFSPHGTFVVFVSGFSSPSDDLVKIWKSESGYSNSKTVDCHSKPVTVVSFAPDGQLVASRSNEEVKIWDATSGECLFTFDSDDRYSIGFSPNSEFVACPRRKQGSIWTIWSVRARRPVKKQTCDARFVAISSDGTQMVSLSYSGIVLWSLTTGRRLAQLKLGEISKIAFDVDETGVIVTTHDDCTKSWRISPASPPDHGSSSRDSSASLPMVFVPMREQRLDRGAPTPRYHYNRGDEWIINQNGVCILWVPPERRDISSIDIHGKKIAVGTWSGRVYMADFSGTASG